MLDSQRDVSGSRGRLEGAEATEQVRSESTGGGSPVKENPTMTTDESEPADHARARDKESPPDAPEGDARALARAAWFETLENSGDSEKTKRVLWCIRRMGSGEWIPGVSHQEGAKEFGVSLRTMESDAAEASRAIRIFVLGDEDMKALCETALMRAMQMGSNAQDAARGADAITKAVSVMAGIRGFEAPKKVDVGGTLADFMGLAPKAKEDSDQ